MEAKIAGVTGYKSPSFTLDDGGIPTANEWMDTVIQMRERAAEMKIKAVFSPRATMIGVKLAAAGVGRKHLIDMLIGKGLSKTEKDRLGID